VTSVVAAVVKAELATIVIRRSNALSAV